MKNFTSGLKIFFYKKSYWIGTESFSFTRNGKPSSFASQSFNPVDGPFTSREKAEVYFKEKHPDLLPETRSETEASYGKAYNELMAKMRELYKDFRSIKPMIVDYNATVHFGTIIPRYEFQYSCWEVVFDSCDSRNSIDQASLDRAVKEFKLKFPSFSKLKWSKSYAHSVYLGHSIIGNGGFNHWELQSNHKNYYKYYVSCLSKTEHDNFRVELSGDIDNLLCNCKCKTP